MAIGVLGVLVLVGATVSKLTTSGRWNTVLTSNDKRAEECAEAASNLMFKVVKDKVNDDSIFYKHLPLPTNPIELMQSEFMYFRLPAPVATTHINGLSGIGDYQSKGMDIQLDLLSNTLLKKIYEKGINYRYDSETDNKGPLAPLGDMFKSYGGRVSVSCTARIRQSFGILSDNPQFRVSGIELPTKKVTGFFSGIFDKLFPEGTSSVENEDQSVDPVSNDSFKLDSLIEMIPDKPKLLKAPKVGTILINVYGVQIDAGPVIQIFVDMIFDKILDAIGIDVTPRGIAQLIFKNIDFDIKLPFDGIKNKIKETMSKCLPEELRMFTGNIGFGVTVEKKGFLEVETLLDFYPKASDNSHVIRKKLLVQREFRVADIQPIAPSHSFFVANSALTYEDESAENDDGWKGDDDIKWDDGFGDLVVQNMPDFKDLISFIDTIIHDFNFKNILRNVMLPGLVRVNGTHKMQVKIGMFPSLSDFSVENLKKIEVLALAVGHDTSKTKPACDDKGHDDGHNLVPGFKSIPFNFWSNAESFDWGYMAGGNAPGSTYWIPFPPRFARNCFFGYFHISPPFSFRMEGYLTKVYSHLKIHLIQIIIPPIPPWFLGITIPIPWLWAYSLEEPYGFCKWPGYDDEKGKTAWDPSKPANLPENLYSPVQYLKKASYYYNSSEDFNFDIDNRSIMIGDEKVFICDGVTFVNDSLNLPQMKVQGRGIIVATGNISVNGNLERVEHYNDGSPSIFSIVARNGSVMVGPSVKLIEACVYGDRGIQVTPGTNVEIKGNLCINRCKRSDIGGNVVVRYKSKHCRSSLLSMIRPIAKYEPTRYYVTFSSKVASFKFVKPK